MEKHTIQLVLILISLLTFLFSCSTDPDGPEDVFNDEIITIDENPTQGTVIGMVNANVQGNYAFTIERQNPEGALDINAATGELLVSNELLFDYETHRELTATIKATNTEGSTTMDFTIVLNDIDDMVFFLETSREAYLEASYGDWMVITEKEYNLLAERINGVVKSGTTDAQYVLEGTTSLETFDATYGNYNAHNIPEQHRLFAFKYYATAEDVEGVNIKIALADISPAYASLPTVLPPHGKGHQFFVLKGGSDPALRELRLGMYSPKGGLVVIDSILNSEVLFSSENQVILDDFPPIQNAIGRYQGLSTNIVQWD